VEGDQAAVVWSDRIILAARKAAADLRADDAFEHAAMVEDLEALVARLTARSDGGDDETIAGSARARRP